MRGNELENELKNGPGTSAYIVVNGAIWRFYYVDVSRGEAIEILKGLFPKHFNPIQDGHFWGCSRMGGSKKAPIPKICHRYPTMMKLGMVIPYLKKIQKIYESRDTPSPWVLLTSAFFHRKSENFVISRNTDVDCISIHNF